MVSEAMTAETDARHVLLNECASTKEKRAALAVFIAKHGDDQAAVNRLVRTAKMLGHLNQRTIDSAIEEARQARHVNGYGQGPNGWCETPKPEPEPKQHHHAPILTLDAWLSRDLPEPDRLMGNWLTTTSRIILNAATGLGKSMYGIGLGMHSAAGRDFLHWRAARLATVLYTDGEMSRRLLKQRLAEEATRLGEQPKGFHALSHEDIENFAPLNTRQGQATIEDIIKRIGTVDLIIFDNIMSLISGDMKDEESWRQTLPWIRGLTARRIGQLWIHHTGHDESRGYGTKTREWQMDTVIQLDRVERSDTDLSFQLHFSKARERTPPTRTDFADQKIALVGDAWTWQSVDGRGPAKISQTAAKFLDALRDATIGSNAIKVSGCPTASIDGWQNECFGRGLIDRSKPDSARSLFSKYKRELIVTNHIACNETVAWTL